MVEPTESESKEELDRFCDAMIKIRKEIREVEEGRADAKDNLLKHAPHTAATVSGQRVDRPYTREQAVYPIEYVRAAAAASSSGPSVCGRRIDSAYGDRNLICFLCL
jgi:glycine dehydrogenase